MTLTQVGGVLIILVICPILGALPLINWLTGLKLTKMGTGNISVSAAFYHGGTWIGILAVLSEAGKGIMAVILARFFFPPGSLWELIALSALVVGRYWGGKGAGTTNIVWGIVVHSPITALLVFLIGGVSFTILRERTSAKYSILILLALILSLQHSGEPDYLTAVIALCGLMAWIYQKIPDDLDLPTENAQKNSQKMLKFFRGDKAILTLNQPLDGKKVGQKAANLSQLKRWGYLVPDGWVWLPGDDLQTLIDFLAPSPQLPLIVRTSALGEDTETSSAAGQYTSVKNITNKQELTTAILDCLASYSNPNAAQYREDNNQKEEAMAIIIQKQIRGIWGGVTFSRDPVNRLNNCVLIEALPGDTSQVVSGKVTPQQYQVEITTKTIQSTEKTLEADFEQLIYSLAKITREIEELYHGIPQDIEWIYDGEKLWILQTRPITTLQPIWTRKIAAEVIPGVIHPLTWSINQPLTCGVWGKLFTLVLGKKAHNLDFQLTATLHYHRAYFNATLLGEIFLKMGLPPESLEFLTKGEKFTKPALNTTLSNLAGLLRLARQELFLYQNFCEEYRLYFKPILKELKKVNYKNLDEGELLKKIEKILLILEKTTYYSILAPLSFALRQTILKVNEKLLDNSKTPEVESMRNLAFLASEARKVLPKEPRIFDDCGSLFAYLSEIPEGQNILVQFDEWLADYGYLGQVATDIAVPRWKDEPRPVREIFTQFILHHSGYTQLLPNLTKKNWKTKLVQKRLNLKARVNTVYSKFLAHLRWYFLALAQRWVDQKILEKPEDIFYLTLEEVRALVQDINSRENLKELIQKRKFSLEKDKEITNVPLLIYGKPQESLIIPTMSPVSQNKILQGIGASEGIVEGKIRILKNLQTSGKIDKNTIVVVPYTDSGWTVVLSRAGGIIAEVGGRLSHGAIIAREYGIPSVMDIHHATEIFKNGQKVRLNGQLGTVEILD